VVIVQTFLLYICWDLAFRQGVDSDQTSFEHTFYKQLISQLACDLLYRLSQAGVFEDQLFDSAMCI
jgi:hypothetical protein